VQGEQAEARSESFAQFCKTPKNCAKDRSQTIPQLTRSTKAKERGKRREKGGEKTVSPPRLDTSLNRSGKKKVKREKKGLRKTKKVVKETRSRVIFSKNREQDIGGKVHIGCLSASETRFLVGLTITNPGHVFRSEVSVCVLGGHGLCQMWD